MKLGWCLRARTQERRPQEYVWLLVLDSNWLVDRVQPVSNPGLRVTHSWGTSFLLGGFLLFARAKELQETKYCMPYPTPVFKQHYMLQELGMACNTWFLVVRARTSTWQKGTGNTDTIFLSNALPVTVTGSIWQEVSVCDTGNGWVTHAHLILTSHDIIITCQRRYQVK